MPEPPYVTSMRDPSGGKDAYNIAADRQTIGIVKPSEARDEWVLSSRGPVAFENVNFEADDVEEAVKRAKGWLKKYLVNERPDLRR